jgi:hypothetical protein
VAITIFGRGWPLSATVTDAGAIYTVNEGDAMAITSGGILSATTLSAINCHVTSLTATLTGTTFSGDKMVAASDLSGVNCKVTTLTASTVSAVDAKVTTLTATTVSAATFSGSTEVSAGGTPLTFAGGGSGTLGAQVTSANRFLRVIAAGVTYYVPCFTTYAGSGGVI